VRSRQLLVGTWVVVAPTNIYSPDITEIGLLVFGFVIGVFPRIAWQVVQATTKK
jgi:hypothetical protein